MTLKNSFYKWLKEGLRSRLWAVALIGLAFFFTFPVAVSMMARHRPDINETRWYLKRITEWLAFGNPLVIFLVITASVIGGMSSFGYINSKSKVDFYHSLPIRREKLYLVNYTAGILVFAFPYAVMLFLGTVVAGVYGVPTTVLWPAAAVGFLLNLIYYILMYTVVIIAVMMTGNRIIAYLGTLVFNFIVPGTALVLVGYWGVFFITRYSYLDDGLEWTRRISPVIEYVRVAGNYRAGVSPAGAAAKAVLAAAVLGVLGCLLYRKRPSEGAGKAMVFEITKPVIRIMIVMVSALSFALFMWSIQESVGWVVFGILCGGTIAHCVIEIIYHFEFKKLFSHKLQLAGCLAAAFLIFCLFRFDWLGYDSYLPEASQLRGAAVDVSLMNNWTSYGAAKQNRYGTYDWEAESGREYIWEHMQGADVPAILQMAEQGVVKVRENRRNGQFYQTGEMVTICYTLNNGRRVYRCYFLNYDEMREALISLCGQPAYQSGIYPVMNLDKAAVVQIRYREYEPEIRLEDLSGQEKENLLTVYQQELGQMSPVQMEKEAPVGLLRFVTDEEMPALLFEENEERAANRYSYNYYQFAERNFYPVYPSFTNTCRLLRQYGIDPGDDLRRYQTEYYTMSVERWDDAKSEYNYQEYTIDGSEQIEVLDSLISLGSLTYYNSFYDAGTIDLTAYKWNSGNLEPISVAIPTDKISDLLTSLQGQERGQEKGE